jgi:hypothetical protein
LNAAFEKNLQRCHSGRDCRSYETRLDALV